MTARFGEELRLLYKYEAEYKIPAAPVVRQLVTDSERSLPDVLPKPPEWRRFEWPASGEVNLTGERFDVKWNEQ